MDRFITYSLLLFLVHFSSGQELTPELKCKTKLPKLGEHMEVLLQFEHPRSMEVVFPSEDHDFGDFELVSKSPYSTQSDSSTSVDSCLYVIRTFDLKSPLSLSLPVYILKNGDSLSVTSNTVEIDIKHVLTEFPKAGRLQEDTEYQSLETKFNYIWFWAILGAMVLIAVILLFIFGKRLVALLRIKKLEKDHRKFLIQYKELAQAFSSEGSSVQLEKLIACWKQHAGKLEKLPLPTFTSKELLARYDEIKLREGFQAFDSFIYGGIKNQEFEGHVENLKLFVEQLYVKRKEELSRG